MKTNRIAVCAIIAVLLAATGTLSFADGGKPRASAHVADGSLSGVSIALDSKSYEGSTASSMPWGSSLTFKAEVYWDDGTAATGSFAAVDWSLSSQSGLASKVWTKKWIGGDGIARIKLFAPYGWTGSLTLKAVSAKDSSRSGTQAIGVTDGTGKTGTRYFSGLFGYDEFVNGRPEQWDSAKGTYSMTLGPVPDDIQQNPKALPGTFRWVAYVDDSSPGIEYKANSTITLTVDKYESCGIAANVDVRHDPLVPPPPVRYYKHISGVKVSEGGTDATVMWNRVKSAKGYIVMRYSQAKKKFVKAAVLKGRSRSDWVDTKVEMGKTYKYKVQPYKIVNGKKKRIKASYWVSAIVGSEQYSNAISVKLSQSKAIKKKAGRTAKLRATVWGFPGEKLINSKVRWYTSDKKIASVSKSGAVKLRKKGTCYVWAKAHNGVNSKRVKVVVR